MKNWRKSLLAAGILATVLAGTAFAATEAEDAATQKMGLEHNIKLEQQAPDMEKGQPPSGFGREGHRRGPCGRHGKRFHGHHGGPRHHHGGEFRGHHGGPRHHHGGEFRGHHGGPRHHGRGFRGEHGDRMHRPGKLTPDQRQQLAKEREEFFANWSSMSERERREATEKFIHRVNEERMKNMTDPEKKAFEKRQAARKAEREKIAKMTDDERHAYFKKKHDEMVQKRTKNMTKEEKERFLARDKRQQERMEEFWKKWKQMTPEEREQWKKERRRFGPGRRHGFRHGHGPAGSRPDAPADK